MHKCSPILEEFGKVEQDTSQQKTTNGLSGGFSKTYLTGVVRMADHQETVEGESYSEPYRTHLQGVS